MIEENETARLTTGKFFGHYKVLEELGAGGMGKVYLAWDTKLDRKVAVKILNKNVAAHESSLSRFVREAKAASALNHPNILVIHEIGESDDGQYIVSEFVEGKTLRELIGASKLNLAEILDISVQTVGALSAAHAAKIIHRDIKPENIVVRPDGYVKILDFGLAKLIEQKLGGLEDETVKLNLTASGTVVGTVNYMSPEQARGETVDARTDIFSFGVMLYEMVAGRTPFAGDSMSETFANLLRTEPLSLSSFTSNVPDGLQQIVDKTLKKNKAERYQTMNGLLMDLQELRTSLTIEEKLEHLRPPTDENKTVLLPVETGDLAERTKPINQLSRIIQAPRGKIFASGLLLILLLAVPVSIWRWRQCAARPPVIKSLAVLPLKSLDSGENYLGLGIADAVIRRISQTGELSVRPTSAVRHYLNEETDALAAAKQLETDAVLEGSVQKSGDRLRVSVNLLRSADEKSVWTDSFDLPATDTFAVQDKVSQQVVSRLQLRLNSDQQARLNKRSTSDPIAYDYYVRGIYAFDERGYGDSAKPQMDATIDLFKKAVEADPNFALAHAKLGYAYVWTAIFIDKQQIWAERAAEEIDRSEKLDPQLPETHVARFLLMLSAYQNWQVEAGVLELLSAQQLDPNVGHAELAAAYFHMGLDDLVERELQRAIEIDPTSNSAKSTALDADLNLNKYDEWFAALSEIYAR